MNLPSLINDVLSRAGETSSTTAGDLPSGSGGAPTIATTAQITTYLNDAAADIARTCYRLDSMGQFMPSANSALISFRLLTYADALVSVLWAARSVLFNGVPLKRCTEARLAVEFPNYASDISSTPAYWYECGVNGIGLYPRPAVGAQTLQINGLALPALLTGTDSPTWLPDDEHFMLSLYAAGMLAMKNAEDPSLASRGPELMAQYVSRKAMLLRRLCDTDPGVAAAYYPPLPAIA